MQKKKMFMMIGAGIVAAAAVSFGIFRFNGSAAALGVKTETLKKQDIISTISASGVVEEVDKEEIFFDTALKVKKVLVEKDDKVAKGQKLIEFDTDSLISEFEQLKLNREIQALNLKKIRETGNTQNLKSLQLSVQQAGETLEMDRRSLEQAAKDYENSKVLFNNGAISKSDYQKYEKTFKDAENKVKASGFSYESAKTNYDNASKNNAIDLSSQEAQLKLKDIAVSDMDKKLARIAANSTSPIDGVVTEVNVSEGDMVKTSVSAFTISNDKKLQIKAEVKEFDSKNVKVGQTVTVTGDGIAENEEVKGTVTAISSKAQKIQTTSGEETIVKITVAIDSVSETLKPGLTVTCKVAVSSSRDAVVAKYSMLRDGSDGSKSVFLYTGDGTVHEAKVKTGITSDLNVEITEGLAGTEEVVVNPPKELQTGMKVQKGTGEKKAGASGLPRPPRADMGNAGF